MKIIVFGANGRVGRLVVSKLLEKRHTVTAFVYGPHSLIKAPKLRIVEGSVESKSVVSDAVAGSDVIISTLGSWGTKNKNILSVGMSSILPAAKKHGVNRIISLTGADATFSDEKVNILRKLTRLILKIIVPRILYDAENHMVLLRNSAIGWTVVRSPVMSDKGIQNNYTLSRKPPKPWRSVLRVDVADAIVDIVEANNWKYEAPFINKR